MDDLFEKEEAALLHAKSFLDNLQDFGSDYYKELEAITYSYETLLRQARLLVHCSDLTATGLNSDKLDLLDKVNIDELTGIYNRRFLEDNLGRYLNGGQLSLLMLDLDFFKNYNDTYGHTAGDICLKKVASALQASLSKAEHFAARYGGEEFVIVLSGTDQKEAMEVADHILENVRSLQIPHRLNGDTTSCVTVSIGVTSANSLELNDPQKYIDQADTAMYHSKRTGRNKITLYTT